LPVAFRTQEELEGAVRDFASSSGPAFLEVMIDTKAMVYPMVGPGSAYKDMVTGEWIKSRGKAMAPNQHGDAVPDLF
jgi:acetolactate synthase-1/2/3 large subunit